jgi:hypothetical protein
VHDRRRHLELRQLGCALSPAGFTGYVNYDLNSTVGGNFIYLMYKESDPTDGCIREVAFSNNNPCPNAPSGWQVICKDLNAGAGGDFIWLLYTRAGTMGAVTAFEVQNDPIPPVGFTATNWMQGKSSPGLAGHPAELNKGAGGGSIFLSTRNATE